MRIPNSLNEMGIILYEGFDRDLHKNAICQHTTVFYVFRRAKIFCKIFSPLLSLHNTSVIDCRVYLRRRYIKTANQRFNSGALEIITSCSCQPLIREKIE